MKYSIIIVWAFLFQACSNDKNMPAIEAGEAIQADSLPSSCPFLARDHKGNIILSWARMINDSSAVFCFAVSANGGQSFGETRLIPSSDNLQAHSENLPKIIVKPSGEFMALWGAANPNPKNKYSGRVFYSESFNEGRTWTDRKTLVSDSASFDQRYYDMALLPNNELAIVWLDNRKISEKEGSGLYFAVTDGRKGFQKERLISQQCCQCCRTDLFVDSKSNIHVLYRGIINDSIRDMLHIVSVDGGTNFSAPSRISNDNWVIKGCPHTGPSMAENREGLHFSWFTGSPKKGCFYTQSTDNGGSFEQRDEISPLGSHPQVASFPNGKLAVVWDEPIQVKNKYYKRIGMQLRSERGIKDKTTFLTSDTHTASYPVVAAEDDHTSLVAYTIKKADKTYVHYQLVKLD